MVRESTLDEFVDTGESEADAAADDGETTAGGTDATADDPGATADDASAGPSVADATPAAPTCWWRTGEAACAGCGASVEWLWAAGYGEDGDDDGRRVCADCKDW